MRRATHAGSIGFSAMLAFQVALAAGAPLGQAAWGGTHATERRYRWATLGLVGILALSALINVASGSHWERYLLAPVALALAVLCAVVAYGVTPSL